MSTDPIGLSIGVIQRFAHQVKNEVIFFCTVDRGQVGVPAITVTSHLGRIHSEIYFSVASAMSSSQQLSIYISPSHSHVKYCTQILQISKVDTSLFSSTLKNHEYSSSAAAFCIILLCFISIKLDIISLLIDMV